MRLFLLCTQEEKGGGTLGKGSHIACEAWTESSETRDWGTPGAAPASAKMTSPSAREKELATLAITCLFLFFLALALCACCRLCSSCASLSCWHRHGHACLRGHAIAPLACCVRAVVGGRGRRGVKTATDSSLLLTQA